LTEANGHAERIAALHMIEPRSDRPTPITLGADNRVRACRTALLTGLLAGNNPCRRRSKKQRRS
jgi:hypothetical protein